MITGVDTNPLHLLQAIEEVGIPTFRGMKFTDFNTWYLENCLTHSGGIYDIAYGRDECLLAGIATGEAMCTPNAQRSTDGDAQVDADPSLKAAIPAGRDRCAFQTLPVRWQLRRTALDC